jgi:hypothetical protein
MGCYTPRSANTSVTVVVDLVNLTYNEFSRHMCHAKNATGGSTVLDDRSRSAQTKPKAQDSSYDRLKKAVGMAGRGFFIGHTNVLSQRASLRLPSRSLDGRNRKRMEATRVG